MKKNITTFFVVLLLVACTHKQPQQTSRQRPIFSEAELAKYVQSDLTRAFITDSFKFMQPLLDSIVMDDQRYRLGGNMQHFMANITRQTALDSVNVIRIKRMVQQYGWLGFKQIGIRSVYLSVVLLHLAKREDWDYFLPITITAYCDNKLPSSGFFAFVDRYLKARQQLQLFGTEIISTNAKGQSILYPVYAPLQLEQRWAKYGSGVFKYRDYIKSNYEIIWDAAIYDKEMLQQARLHSVDTGTAEIGKILYLLDSCKKKG